MTLQAEIYIPQKGDTLPGVQSKFTTHLVVLDGIDDRVEMMNKSAEIANRIMEHEKADTCSIEIKNYSEDAVWALFTGYTSDFGAEDDWLFVDGIQFINYDEF